MNKICCIALSFLWVSLSPLFAVTAYPDVLLYDQPDGTQLSIRLHGDEIFNYVTTEDGYLLTAVDGIYEYASLTQEGFFTSLSVKANNPSQRTLTEREFLKRLSPDVISNTDFDTYHTLKKNDRQDGLEDQVPNGLRGHQKALVILVEFPDQTFIAPNPAEQFSNLLNQKGYKDNGATGSARDYFSDNSNGVFAPDFIVVGPVSLDQTYNYYGQNINGSDANPRQMIIDACKKADTLGIDFTEYDTDGDGQIFEFATINKMNGMASYTWKLGNTYTPDNFLVTPGLEMGVDMRLDYVIYPQSKATKYAEKFAIVISADSITAENCRDAVCLDSLRFPASYRVDSIRSVIHTIAIPREFENKKVWMAIRHFDVTNKSALFIEKLKIY